MLRTPPTILGLPSLRGRASARLLPSAVWSASPVSRARWLRRSSAIAARRLRLARLRFNRSAFSALGSVSTIRANLKANHVWQAVGEAARRSRASQRDSGGARDSHTRRSSCSSRVVRVDGAIVRVVSFCPERSDEATHRKVCLDPHHVTHVNEERKVEGEELHLPVKKFGSAGRATERNAYCTRHAQPPQIIILLPIAGTIRGARRLQRV